MVTAYATTAACGGGAATLLLYRFGLGYLPISAAAAMAVLGAMWSTVLQMLTSLLRLAVLTAAHRQCSPLDAMAAATAAKASVSILADTDLQMQKRRQQKLQVQAQQHQHQPSQQSAQHKQQSTPAPKCVPSVSAAAVAQPLLPCRASNHPPHHLTVVLDLDETLLCAYPCDSLPTHLMTRSRATSRLHPFRTHSSTHTHSSSSSSSSSGGSDGGVGTSIGVPIWVTYGASADHTATVAVFPRPGVHEFLRQLSQCAELVLFTAAQPAYAEPLAALLDPTGKLFAARLYREATVGGHGLRAPAVKDLSRLGRDLARTVLVDNSPYSFVLQPANGVPCVPFHGSRRDSHLLDVILPLLQSLSEVDADVRPILAARFRMGAWFRSKGLPVPDEDFGSSS